MESRLQVCADIRCPELDFDIDEPFEKTVLYKNRALTRSCLLHFAVVRSAGSRSEGANAVRFVLECGADVRAKARYANPNDTETEIEAIHMAAGLGSIAILEVLLEFAACGQPLTPQATLRDVVAEYVSTWAKMIPGRDKEEDDNYQPLHDAAFGRRRDTLLWLLKHGADPQAQNIDGCTALHFVALNGIADDSSSAVEEVVSALLKHDGSMSSLTTVIHQSHYSPHMRGRIPLELAALGGSQFPKDCMYLLAPSHWDADTEPRFFEDLLLLANSNTTHAADALARKIYDRASQCTTAGSMLRGRVRQEAQKWVAGCPGPKHENSITGAGCGSKTLASLFFLAPKAAADMVDILTAKPLVQDAAKHPIPSRASLTSPNPVLFGRGCQPMLCRYQADATKHRDLIRPEWKFDAEKTEQEQPELRWHRELLPEISEDSVHRRLGRRSNIFSVSVKVLLWPNILDLDVCRALVCTSSKNDKIFARLPVQAIVYWFWNNLGFPAFVTTWLFCCIELATLVQWGLGHEEQRHVPHRICWTILVAGNIRESTNLLWCFKEYCVRWWGHSRSDALSNSSLRFLWEPSGFVSENMVDVTSVILRMWLLQDNRAEVTDFGQSLIAVNVMFGFFRLIYMLRMLDDMGKGILAILETFFSGTIQHMLLICAMIFVNFFLAFVMLARNQEPLQVFLHLYRGLLFGDGEALDYLGLDEHGDEYAHIQLGPYVSINMNRILAVMGTLFFSVIILNLIIAIYSNEYEKVQRVTNLLFLKQRLRMTCDSVLAQHKLVGKVPCWLSMCIFPVSFALAFDLLLPDPFLPWPQAVLERMPLMVPAVLIALGQNILQLVVLHESSQCFGVQSDEPCFLWICHRSDFNARAYDARDVTTEDLKHLQDEMNGKIGALDYQVAGLGERLDAKLDRVLSLMERSVELRGDEIQVADTLTYTRSVRTCN